MSDLWPPTIPPDVVNDTDQLDVHAQYHNDLAAGVSMLAARAILHVGGASSNRMDLVGGTYVETLRVELDPPGDQVGLLIWGTAWFGSDAACSASAAIQTLDGSNIQSSPLAPGLTNVAGFYGSIPINTTKAFLAVETPGFVVAIKIESGGGSWNYGTAQFAWIMVPLRPGLL